MAVGSLQIVVPTVGRSTCWSVVRDRLEREEHLARLTVVNQAGTPVVDSCLRDAAERRGVQLHEVRVDRPVGPGEARFLGATMGDEEFIGFIDDDILVERGSLSTLVERCEQDHLGGASGVLTTPQSGPLARLAKALLFHSIFRDRRAAASRSARPTRSNILSGGMTVYRRALYLRCAPLCTRNPPFICGEDVELSFEVSRHAPLVLDPSVRVVDRHVELSLGPADRRSRALAHLQRYRTFADRHATTRRHWVAYQGVLVGVLARGWRQRHPLPFLRQIAGEAGRAARRAWRGGAPSVAQTPPDAGGTGRSPRPTVAAVIVLFHSEDVVEACVRSLVQGHRCPDVIAVVANSPIPTAVADRLRHMGAQLLPCEGNRGFAAACNRAASESNTDFLWFVNPDVECDASCLERLLAAAGPDATVAPTLRDAHGVLASPAKSSRYLSPWVLLARELRIGRWLRLGEAPVGRPHAATAMSGACLLVPRPAFLDVGGFDERYFLYGEDVDLCLRLAAAAVRLRVVADAVATHRAGTGSGSPPLPAVQGIKGREARRAHYLLLARYRSSTAAARYVRGLVWVLRARLAVARLVNPSVWDRDRSAYRWAVEQARSAGHGGE